MPGLPVVMSNDTWDSVVTLDEPSHAQLIELLFQLIEEGPGTLGIDQDPWGRYNVQLPGECFVVFEERATPEPHIYLYPPVPWEEPPNRAS